MKRNIFHYKNDAIHRDDGPAVEYVYSQIKEYWLDGEELPVNSDKEFEQYKRLVAFI
jgi:hypothetical protein